MYVRISVGDPDPCVFGPPGSAYGSVSQRYGSEDPHPDPYQNVMDPQLWFGSCVCVCLMVNRVESVLLLLSTDGMACSLK